jgi:hypothetical protein
MNSLVNHDRENTKRNADCYHRNQSICGGVRVRGILETRWALGFRVFSRCKFSHRVLRGFRAQERTTDTMKLRSWLVATQ